MHTPGSKGTRLTLQVNIDGLKIEMHTISEGMHLTLYQL